MDNLKISKNLMVTRLGKSCTYLNNLPKEDAIELLEYAYQKGIRLFDVSHDLPETEVILGEWLKQTKHIDVIVSSKNNVAVKNIKDALNESLDNLQLRFIHLYSICGVDDLPLPMTLEALYYLKTQEMTGSVICGGVSLYKKRLIKDLILQKPSFLQFPVSAVEHGVFIEIKNLLKEFSIPVIATNILGSSLFLKNFEATTLIKGVMSLLQDNPLLITMKSKKEIDFNVDVVNTYDGSLFPLIKDICNGCQECDDFCVNNFTFSKFIRYCRNARSENEYLHKEGIEQLKGMYIEEDCLSCARCKDICPLGLDIGTFIKETLIELL